MNLTRGANGLFPCPICYVPKNEQSDLQKAHPPRCTEESQKSYLDVMAQPKTAGEALLKSKGLCSVEVRLIIL